MEEPRYEKTKKMYIKFKEILNKIEAGGVESDALLATIPNKYLLMMEAFVAECEDMGYSFVTNEKV